MGEFSHPFFMLILIKYYAKTFSMKKLLTFCSLFVLAGCVDAPIRPPISLKSMQAQDYTLATWYHIEEAGKPIRIYIEGDGHAFNANHSPTSDPTPKNNLWQEMARTDPNPNVAYLARPCQYIKSKNCSVKDWTTGRFSNSIIASMDKAVQELMRKAGTNKAIILGYSGGGQVAAMLSVQHPENTLYLYTVAGVLDHVNWTKYHNATPLNASRRLDIKHIYTIPQMHFVGDKDTVVPPQLTEYVMPGYMITHVPDATHTTGWDVIKPKLYKEIEN